jgi:hypothetical protein
VFITRPSVKLPAEALQAVYNGVHVPWQGGMGRLMVNRPILGSVATIEISGQTVARPKRATLQDPWIECEIPEAGPHQLVVVQVQPAPTQQGILVFVDGTCLQGGGSLEEWRTRQPRPRDQFEQVIMPVYWWEPLGRQGGDPYRRRHRRGGRHRDS